MDRPQVHNIPKRRVQSHLRRLGLKVESAKSTARYDFLADGRTRIAVRTAFASSYQRRVKGNGRLYQYEYRAWSFNFHHRGQISNRYCDVFVCVPLGKGSLEMSDCYVIPWEARTGKTFYLPDSKKKYAGKYAIFRGAWNELVGADLRV